MGYEVVYQYYEEISKGEYNKEEVKEKVVKIGSAYEEVPIEQLAGRIIAQLARRNILVVDVKINEYIKKPISFRETPDGILIKNKKFSFDGGACIAVDNTNTDCNEETTIDNISEVELKKLLNKISDKTEQKPKNVVAMVQKPIRKEIFDPVDPLLKQDARARGLKFTVGKQYPIFSERFAGSAMLGMIYIVQDDEGNKQSLSDKFFVPITNLTGIGDTGTGNNILENWGESLGAEANIR